MARVRQLQDFFEIRYYNQSRICLSLAGLWPYKTSRERYIRTALLSIGLLLTLILQVITMINVDNYDLFIEIISNFLLFLNGVTIYYNSVFNVSKIAYMCEFIKRDWLEPKTTKQLEIMKEYAEIGRSYALMLFVSPHILLIMIMTMSIAPVFLDIVSPLNTTRPRVSPFPMELLFDTQEHFILSLLITYSFFLCLTLSTMCNYMLVTVIVQYICGAFRVAESMLDDAIDVKTISIRDHNSEARAYGMIVRGIKYHNNILEFIDKFNATFEYALIPAIFISIIFTVIAFLRLLLNDMLNHERMRETIISISNITFTCGVLYIMNYMGQKIIDHSVSFFDKAYDIPWYVLSNCKKSKTLVWFIMMRSLKPSSLSIANFFSLSFKFFASIIQTSISYAMVIYSIR